MLIESAILAVFFMASSQAAEGYIGTLKRHLIDGPSREVNYRKSRQ